MMKRRFILLMMLMSMPLCMLMALRPRTPKVVHDTIYVRDTIYIYTAHPIVMMHDTIDAEQFVREMEEMMAFDSILYNEASFDFDIDALNLDSAARDSLLREIELDREMAMMMDSILADSTALAESDMWKWSDAETRKDMSVADQVIMYGKQVIGRPYVYGASGPRAFDCSGFTCYVFNKAGIRLPRTSSAQSQMARRVKGGFKNLQKGDLVFFGRHNNRVVGHVGIVISASENDFTFIHAATHSGITISRYSQRYYRSCYMFAGRILRDFPRSKKEAKKK